MPLLLALLAAGVIPVEAADLFRSRAIVTGSGETSRDVATTSCFRNVMVKASGDPSLIDDPRLAEVETTAAAHLIDIRFRDLMAGIPVHDEQGTRERPHEATARFDPAGVEAALARLGRKPWPEPRPAIVAHVAVDNGTQTYVLASDGDRGRDQRDALAAAADRFGLDVSLPSRAEIEARAMRPEDTTGPAVSGDTAPSGTVLLSGRLAWDAGTLGWKAVWRLGGDFPQPEWRIDGVSFDKAFANGIGQAAARLSGNAGRSSP